MCVNYSFCIGMIKYKGNSGRNSRVLHKRVKEVFIQGHACATDLGQKRGRLEACVLAVDD